MRRNRLLKHVIKIQKEGTPKGQEYEEEDVCSYWMYWREKDYTATEHTKNEAI